MLIDRSKPKLENYQVQLVRHRGANGHRLKEPDIVMERGPFTLERAVEERAELQQSRDGDAYSAAIVAIDNGVRF